MADLRPGSLVCQALAHCFGKFVRSYFLAARQLSIGIGEPSHRRRILHDRQRLFEPFQVRDGDQHGGWAAVDSDSHPLMLVMYAANKL
jgi:hypothetical protein